MLDMFVTRKRFHQMIWTNPRALLLSRLALQEQVFLDLCRDNAIPAPPGLAWVKPMTSSQHFRARMPKREVGQNPFVFFRADFSEALRRERFEEMLNEPFEELAGMTERFRKRLSKINHAIDPFRLHEAIANVLHAVPLQAAQNGGRIDAGGNFERRRLNLLNEIFLYAEAVGGQSWFGGASERQHSVKIGHVTLFFTLDRFDHSDRLRLEIRAFQPLPDARLSWQDTSSVSLENILPDIMVGMGVAAETICRQERDNWRQWSPITSATDIAPPISAVM